LGVFSDGKAFSDGGNTVSGGEIVFSVDITGVFCTFGGASSKAVKSVSVGVAKSLKSPKSSLVVVNSPN